MNHDSFSLLHKNNIQKGDIFLWNYSDVTSKLCAFILLRDIQFTQIVDVNHFWRLSPLKTQGGERSRWIASRVASMYSTLFCVA